VERQLSFYNANNYSGPPLPQWVRPLLLRLKNAVPAQHPVEVLAITGMYIAQKDVDWTMQVVVRMLVQRGWSVEMSLLMYRNFRLAYPMLRYKPEMYALLSRKQLREEFGSTYGDVIADICVDPDSQPVFSRMLSGNLDDLVLRPAMHVMVAFDIDQLLFHDSASTLPVSAKLSIELSNVQSGQLMGNGGPPQSLTMSVASSLYREATGSEPEFMVPINPREIDYENFASVGEALRQADSPG